MIQKMLSHIRNQWSVDDLLTEISSEVNDGINDMLTRWKQNSLFQSHIELIQRATERYIQKDFVSATAILYPRIEGIMRDFHHTSGTNSEASQKNLITSVIEPQAKIKDGLNLLLPDMFRRYLQDVYFCAFEPGKPAPLSRNSVGHGVADPKDFSLKGDTIGLLIIDQLFFFLSGSSPQESNK
jgi:hypothetical protein